MPDIIITVVSGETTNLGLSIPGVQGPIGADTMPSGGTVGQILVKQSTVDYDSGWASSASGLTLQFATVSGLTLQGTASGGTFVASTISGAIINAPIISGGTYNNASIIGSTYSGGVIHNITLSGTIANAGTISGGTYLASSISGATIFASALSGSTLQDATSTAGTFSSPSLVSPTISGNIAANGGVTVFASGASAGFFGASPVVCPSGIVIPSGGSSTAEVLTALSGVIVALQSLGLVRG